MLYMYDAFKRLFDYQFDDERIYLIDIGFFIIFMVILTVYFIVKLYLSRKIDKKEIRENRSLGFINLKNILLILYVVFCVTIRTDFLYQSLQASIFGLEDALMVLYNFAFSLGRFTFLFSIILLYSYTLKWLYKVILINKIIPYTQSTKT